MNPVRYLRVGEYVVYLVILILTAVVLGVAIYMALFRIYEIFTTATDKPEAMAQAVYNALSDIFLVVIFVELIDTFITYLEQRRVVVYKIIDVALVALARELFIYLAPVNKEFDFYKAVAIVAATFVVGVVAYLQRKALARKGRGRR